MKQYKQRYFIVKLFNNISKEDLIGSVEDTFKNLHGIISFSFSKLKLIYFDEKNNVAVFRCNNEFSDHFRTSILFLRKANVIIQAKIELTSGTLKKIKRKLNMIEKVKSGNN